MADKSTAGVVLGARRQNLLADVCCVLRTWRYKELTAGAGLTDFQDRAFAAVLAAELRDVCERFDVSAQEFDGLYDVFHRAGANS